MSFTLYLFVNFSDVVHSASSNMLPYRTQPAVVCVAQVKSTVKHFFKSLDIVIPFLSISIENY